LIASVVAAAATAPAPGRTGDAKRRCAPIKGRDESAAAPSERADDAGESEVGDDDDADESSTEARFGDPVSRSVAAFALRGRGLELPNGTTLPTASLLGAASAPLFSLRTRTFSLPLLSLLDTAVANVSVAPKLGKRTQLCSFR